MVLLSEKGLFATEFSPISRYMEDFGEEKKLMDPHLFPEVVL